MEGAPTQIVWDPRIREELRPYFNTFFSAVTADPNYTETWEHAWRNLHTNISPNLTEDEDAWRLMDLFRQRNFGANCEQFELANKSLRVIENEFNGSNT